MPLGRIVSGQIGMAKDGPERDAVVKKALTAGAGAWTSAAGLELFLFPNGLIVGGMTGIAALLAHYLHIRTGLLILPLNIPFCWIVCRGYLREFRIWAIYGLAMFSAGSFLLHPVSAVTDHPVLSAVFGGLCFGAGIGLVLQSGGFLDGLAHPEAAGNRAGTFAWKACFVAVTLLILIWAGGLNGPEAALYSAIAVLAAFVGVEIGQHGLSFSRIVRIESAIGNVLAEAMANDWNGKAAIISVMRPEDAASARVVICRVNRRHVPEVSSWARKLDPECNVSVFSMHIWKH